MESQKTKSKTSLSFLEYIKNVRRLSYHTIRAYARAIDEWKKMCAESPESLDGRDYVLALMDRGLEPKSVNLYITACREYYRYMCAFEGESVNPFAAVRRVRVAHRLPKFLPESVLRKYIAEMPEQSFQQVRAKCVLYILFHTGLRCHELVTLLKSDVFSGSVKVRGGKGSKDRVVPITSTTWAMFQKLHELSSCRFSVATKYGTPVTDRQLRIIVANGMGGLPKDTRHPHCLRHSCATALLERGARLPFISMFLGHSSVKTTEIYTHCSPRFLREQYQQCFPR